MLGVARSAAFHRAQHALACWDDEGMGDLDHECAGFDSGIISTVTGKLSFSVMTSSSNPSSGLGLKRCLWSFVLNSNPSPNYRVLILTHIFLHNCFLHPSPPLPSSKCRKSPTLVLTTHLFNCTPTPLLAAKPSLLAHMTRQ